MEDEVYIYEGNEYSRKELEDEYGDRIGEAIEKFGFKKKDETISQDSTEPSTTLSEDIDEEEFSRNRAARDIINSIEKSYDRSENYSNFVKDFGVQNKESVKDFDYNESDFFGLSPADVSIAKRNKILADETLKYGDNIDLYVNTDIYRQSDKINKLYKFASESEEDLINIDEPNKTFTFDIDRFSKVLAKTDKFDKQVKKIEDQERELIESMPDWIDDTVARVRETGRSTMDLGRNFLAYLEPEYVSDSQIKHSFQTIGAKKGVGLTQEQIDKGYTQLLEEGDLEGAYKSFTIDAAGQIPQLALAIGVSAATRNPQMGRKLAARLLGLNAAGAKYAEMYSDPTMSEGMKIFTSAAVGAVEGSLEGLLASDITAGVNLLKRMGAEGVKKNLSTMRGTLAKARNYGLPLAKGVGEEALEEGLASSFEAFVVDHLIRDEEFNPYNIADAAIMGAAMGGGVTSLTLLPSYIGSTKTMKRRAEIAKKIKDKRQQIQSGNLSEQEISMANDQIFKLRKEASVLRNEDADMYKDYSDEDVNEIININRRVSLNRDRAIDSKTEEGKEIINEKIEEDLARKKEIEQNYDSKKEQQVPSTEPEGESPVEAEPDAEASEEKAEADRDVQEDKQQAVEKSKESLSKKLKGDKLLNAQDTVDELADNNAEINDDGTVTVYHRTTREKADEILSKGQMFGLEDGIFFSTSVKGQAEGFGDVVIKMSVPVEMIEIDDVFGNEAHVRIPTKKPNQKVSVKKYMAEEVSKEPTKKTEPTEETTEETAEEATQEATEETEEEATQETTQEKPPKKGKVRSVFAQEKKPLSLGIREGLKKVYDKLFDRQGVVRRLIQNSGNKILEAALSVRAGSSASAKNIFEKANEKIFKGVFGDDFDILNDIIVLRRIISIEKSRPIRIKKLEDMLEKESDEKKIKNLKKKIKDLKEFKHPKDLNQETAQAELDRLRNELDEDKFNDLNERANNFFQATKDILDRKLKEGLINQETYDILSKYEYAPRVFMDVMFDITDGNFKKEEDRFRKTGGLSEAEFKKLEGGSTEDLFTDNEFLLQMLISANEERVFSNRLFKILGKHDADWVSKKAQKGFRLLKYKEEGKVKGIYVRNDIANQIEFPDDGMIDSKVFNFFSTFLGTKILRGMATGYNPLFAISNIPMDFFNIVMFTDVYDKKMRDGKPQSRNVFAAMFDLGTSFLSNFTGLQTKNSETMSVLEEAIEAGMGMDFLTSQGRMKFMGRSSGRIEAGFKGFFNALSHFSETSELGMRLSVYQKVKEESMKQGMSEQEARVYAAFKARATIDFSQGGVYVKNLDKLSPYLNASFQGMRVAGTYIGKNPKKFTSKFAQSGIAVTMLALAAKTAAETFGWDEEDEKAVPNFHKRNYFIIPTGLTIDGNKAYIKIRKNPTFAPFIGFWEGVADYVHASMNGASDKELDDMHTKRYASVIQQVLDATVVGDLFVSIDDQTGEVKGRISATQYLPPVMKAISQYESNYDFFREKNVSYDKLYTPDISPSLEGKFDDNVEDFYKVVGEALELSPKRAKNAAEVVVTSPSTNLLVGASYAFLESIISLGQGEVKEAGEAAKGIPNSAVKSMLKRIGGVADKRYIPKTRIKDLDEAIQSYKDNQFTIRKELTNMVYEDKASKSEVRNYIEQIEDAKLKKYAEDKYKKLQRKSKFDDLVIPGKSTYYDLDDYLSTNPKLAAQYLYVTQGSLTNAELKEIRGYISMIRGSQSFSYPPAL